MYSQGATDGGGSGGAADMEPVGDRFDEGDIVRSPAKIRLDEVVIEGLESIASTGLSVKDKLLGIFRGQNDGSASVDFGRVRSGVGMGPRAVDRHSGSPQGVISRQSGPLMGAESVGR